jgi:hypothetical protein
MTCSPNSLDFEWSPFCGETDIRKSSFTEEQIIGALKEHAAGLSARELCRKYGIQ